MLLLGWDVLHCATEGLDVNAVVHSKSLYECVHRKLEKYQRITLWFSGGHRVSALRSSSTVYCIRLGL